MSEFKRKKRTSFSKSETRERAEKKAPSWPAFDYGVWMLGRREYARQELAQKMKLRGYEPTEIEQALDRLMELGFQSDVRFTQSQVRSKSSRYGNRRLTQQLTQHVDTHLVDEAMEGLDDERTRTLALMSRFDSWDRTNPKQQDKMVRFLMSRGFSYHSFKPWLELWKKGHTQEEMIELAQDMD